MVVVAVVFFLVVVNIFSTSLAVPSSPSPFLPIVSRIKLELVRPGTVLQCDVVQKWFNPFLNSFLVAECC